MSRDEVLGELKGKVIHSRMAYLIHWSTPSLKALLLISRESEKGEREDRVQPQLGITLALRVSLELKDKSELKTKTPPGGGASGLTSKSISPPGFGGQ